jgi:hypothetical protein
LVAFNLYLPVMASLNLSVIEIIILQLGAVVLGVAIHFFLTYRKTLKKPGNEKESLRKHEEDWKLKYFNDMEEKEKELAALKQKISETEEDSTINSIEAEEMRRENKLLKAELDNLKKTSPVSEGNEYISQLTLAQQSLMEHHEKINLLLGQIDKVKQIEEKSSELASQKKELEEKLSALQEALEHKEREVAIVRQKETMTSEMTSRLDNAYTEFRLLQEKIQSLESDAGSAKMLSLELADLKEAYNKMQHDFDEQKHKLAVAQAENQQLHNELAEAEGKYKEAEFLRQQLQKRVVYLEELNRDFQMVAEANKKLEGQIKRIGELESMLNVVKEERDLLARKQMSHE